jgi:CubicO group peptidase (beta-lactamase class C family)
VDSLEKKLKHHAGWTTKPNAQGATPMETSLQSKLETLVRESMADGLVPGLSIVILNRDGTQYAKGFGHANLETKSAFTPDTRCHIGSTGKAFTAVGVMQLRECGLIDLDAPISTYLPDFRVNDPRGASITVRHLLTNDSGLGGSEHDGGTEDEALEKHVKSLTDVALEYAPGSGYAYANSGWSILGLMVQHLSGMPYEQYMREHIFIPLEMHDSTLEYWKPGALGDTNGHRAGTHSQQVVRPAFVNRSYGPAGMHVSTANDISKYLQMLLNNGLAHNGKRILTEASVQEITRGQVTGESSVGLENIRYAFGWETLERHGIRSVEHGGSVGTMGAYFMLAPDNGFGVGVLFNLVDFAKMQLFGNLFHLMAGIQTEPYQSFPNPEAIPATGFKADPDDLERITGMYAMPRSVEVRVYLEHGQLLITAHSEINRLEPRALNSFTSRSEILALEGLEHTFVFTDAGVELHAHTEWGDVAIGRRLERAWM